MDRTVPHPLSLEVGPLGAVQTDLLIVPVFEADDFADVPGLDAATGGEVGRASKNREFTGRPFEVFLTPVSHQWQARRVALVGAGPRAGWVADIARRVASTGVLAARQGRAPRVTVLFRGAPDQADPARTAERLLQALAEGAILALHDTGRHKTTPSDVGKVTDVRLLAPELPASERAGAAAAVARGRVLGECTNLARDLGNEPANLLTPRLFAERARRRPTARRWWWRSSTRSASRISAWGCCSASRAAAPSRRA